MARGRTAVVAIVVGAILLRGGLVLATLDYKPIYDPAAFDRYARTISTSGSYPQSTLTKAGGPTAYRPPAYPVLLAGIYKVTGASVDAARIAQALLGGATVALTGLIAFWLRGRRTALVAMALAAVFPPLLAVDSALLSETLFTPLVLAALAAVLAARRTDRRMRWAAAAGALAGAAMLTRSNGAILLAPLALGLLPSPRAHGWRRAVAAPALMMASAILVLAPWTVRNAVVLDAFVPLTTQLGYTLAGTYNDETRTRDTFSGVWIDPRNTAEYAPLLARTDLGEQTLDRELRARALDYAAARPGYVVRVVAGNTARLAHLDPSYTRASVTATGAGGPSLVQRSLTSLVQWSLIALLPLAAAGAIVAARARAGPAFVWLTPVLLLLSTLPLTSPVRTRVPADPFLLILVAIGATAAVSALARRRSAAPSA